MAKTPISNPDSYVTPGEFLAMVRPQLVREWLSTDGNDVDLDELETNETLRQALAVASGWVEAAVFHAGKYDANDLAVLVGNGRALLADLVASLAIKKLLRFGGSQYDAFRDVVQEANDTLQAISTGVNIFGLQEAADAGVLDHVVETPDQLDALNLASGICSQMFGRRSNRYT